MCYKSLANWIPDSVAVEDLNSTLRLRKSCLNQLLKVMTLLCLASITFFMRTLRTIALVALTFSTPAYAEEVVLSGRLGSSADDMSGWIDLSPPLSFRIGDRLKLWVGGSANRVLVRFLPLEGNRGLPDRVVGIFDVPDDRWLEIVLKHSRTNIPHVSVHGGENPFGDPAFHLGRGNGPASILEILLVRPQPGS